MRSAAYLAVIPVHSSTSAERVETPNRWKVPRPPAHGQLTLPLTAVSTRQPVWSPFQIVAGFYIASLLFGGGDEGRLGEHTYDRGRHVRAWLLTGYNGHPKEVHKSLPLGFFYPATPEQEEQVIHATKRLGDADCEMGTPEELNTL